MDCPHCHFDNPQTMKFCGRCGARLGTACPSCGAPAMPGFKFCGECGASLPGGDAAAPAPAAVTALPTHAASPAGYTPPHLRDQVLQTPTAVEGERKQVTVLFCDLVRSTAIADKLGPEVMHGLLSEFFELAVSEVPRY